MVIAIVILSVLLVVAAAIIFCLYMVLKNTLLITDDLINMVDGRTPKRLKQAYNGQYYPATLIAQVKFNQPSEGKIVDFSRYDSHKLIGFTILTTDKIEDYYGTEVIADLDEETLEELGKPVLIKNVLVYEIAEGNWAWKSAE